MSTDPGDIARLRSEALHDLGDCLGVGYCPYCNDEEADMKARMDWEHDERREDEGRDG